MDVTSIGQAQNNSASAAAGAKLTENFDAFLKLLTTQLQNQDPTEPLDSAEFVGQLVQFSQVEQAIQGNQSLEKLIDLQNTNQTTAALGYIGNQVEITGNIAPLVGGNAEFSYTLPKNAATSTVVIQNAAGQAVFSAPGEITTGKHSFVWDGVGSDDVTAAPGNYRISVVAKDADGGPIDGITTSAFGMVTGLESGPSGVTLDLNGASAALDTVLSVRSPPPTAGL